MRASQEPWASEPGTAVHGARRHVGQWARPWRMAAAVVGVTAFSALLAQSASRHGPVATATAVALYIPSSRGLEVRALGGFGFAGCTSGVVYSKRVTYRAPGPAEGPLLPQPPRPGLYDRILVGLGPTSPIKALSPPVDSSGRRGWVA